MFIGHFGAGLGLKRACPAVSLGTLFLAAQFLDLLWPTLLLLGVEHVEIDATTRGPPLRFTHYPFSHSLALVVLWGVLFGAGHYVARKQPRAALVCFAGVISHWILDLIVHHPDLPVAPGSDVHVGFGLWSSLPVSLALELSIFALGCWAYSRSTAPLNKAGRYGFWGLIAFLVVIQFVNVFGEPAPSVSAVAWVGQAQWLLVIWGYWVDRNRRRTI